MWMNIPMVYEVKQDPFSKSYYVTTLTHKFKEPEKLYGDARRYRDVIWKGLERKNLIGGVMLLGLKGAGKTEIAKSIANRAIDHGMSVYLITNVEFSPDLISFLETLDNAVLFFDEFGKTFSIEEQEKMLTLLSNTLGRRRLVLVTENEPYKISKLIRNRPGRLKYSVTFNKLDKNTIIEYCEEKGVNKSFLDELLKSYLSTKDFTFDHLKAIVEEHLEDPSIPFDTLISVLNVDFMKPTKILAIKRVLKDGKELDKKSYKVVPTTLSVGAIEAGDVYIDLFYNKEESGYYNDQTFFTSQDILEYDGKKLILESKPLRIEYELVEK